MTVPTYVCSSAVVKQVIVGCERQLHMTVTCSFLPASPVIFFYQKQAGKVTNGDQVAGCCDHPKYAHRLAVPEFVQLLFLHFNQRKCWHVVIGQMLRWPQICGQSVRLLSQCHCNFEGSWKKWQPRTTYTTEHPKWLSITIFLVEPG